MLKQLHKLSAVSTREISSTKKETTLTFLQDSLCWMLYIHYSVFTTVPFDELIPYILNWGADRFTHSCRASGWAPVPLCLKLAVCFINENWKEFLMIRIIWRCKTSSFQSELRRIWLLNFLHFKGLGLKSFAIKVVSSPVSSQGSVTVHGV